MRVLITGGAGVLGSNLVELLVKKGHDVSVMDIVRAEDAWRLNSVIDSIKYLWRSLNDVSRKVIKDVDLIIDCAIGSADRPFGIESPHHTTYGNIFPPLHLLEAVRGLSGKRPLIIYPSSFNALYGHGEIEYHEGLLPNPSSLYGWTKASSEMLYLTYYRSYNIPVVVTRTGSAFGPRGRSDELIHKLIIYALNNANFYLRSPHAKRLWTYAKDVVHFYDRLINRLENEPDEIIGKILHVAGNKNDEIIENIKVAKKIKELTNSGMKIIEGEYEPGEIVNGNPISFNINSSITRKLLKWGPEYTLEDGLKETITWFEHNLWRYQVINVNK